MILANCDRSSYGNGLDFLISEERRILIYLCFDFGDQIPKIIFDYGFQYEISAATRIKIIHISWGGAYFPLHFLDDVATVWEEVH